MLDEFARQAYRAHLAHADALVDSLTSLPAEELRKLAFDEGPSSGGSMSWLDRFQGTPLYEQAMELLQEELQQEAENLQNSQMLNQHSSARDQVGLKKKLLELELARSQSAPQPEVPTAAPPGPQGAETQTTVQPPEGAPPKTAEALWMAAMVAPDEKLAAARFEQALQKMAGLGQTLWNVASKNPGLAAGAVGGAAVGASRGGRQTIDPSTGQPTGGGITGTLAGAIGGGALGAGVGLAGQGLLRSGLAAQKTVADATKAGLPHKGFGAHMLNEMGQRVANTNEGLGNYMKSRGEARIGVAQRGRAAIAQSFSAVPNVVPKVVPPAAG